MQKGGMRVDGFSLMPNAGFARAPRNGSRRFCGDEEWTSHRYRIHALRRC